MARGRSAQSLTPSIIPVPLLSAVISLQINELTLLKIKLFILTLSSSNNSQFYHPPAMGSMHQYRHKLEKKWVLEMINLILNPGWSCRTLLCPGAKSQTSGQGKSWCQWSEDSVPTAKRCQSWDSGPYTQQL